MSDLGGTKPLQFFLFSEPGLLAERERGGSMESVSERENVMLCALCFASLGKYVSQVCFLFLWDNWHILKPIHCVGSEPYNFYVFIIRAEYSFLLEITHEQEEPDSAFEATQYFFEEIISESSVGKHRERNLFLSFAFLGIKFYINILSIIYTHACEATFCNATMCQH